MKSQLPNVSSALSAWGQDLAFIVVARRQEDYLTVEEKMLYRGRGVRVPFKPQALSQRPIGERAWKWETIFAVPTITINPGDEIEFGEGQTRYRVMEKRDWSEYGYVEYDICQGFTE